MKITVRISDIEVVIDRPKMSDYDYTNKNDYNGPEWRKFLFEDSVKPMLELAVEKAKELYNLKQI